MAFLQLVRENDPRSYGLGGVGAEVNRFPNISNDDITRMNVDLYAVEVRGMLEIFSDIAKGTKEAGPNSL